MPATVGNCPPAGSYGADPSVGRLPGGAGTLLVLPGTRLDDGGGGGILAGTLLSRALVRRGASATVRREVRPVRVRARVGPGQGERIVRSARRENHPDRTPHTRCGDL